MLPNWNPARVLIGRGVFKSAKFDMLAVTEITAGGCVGVNDPNGNCSTTNWSPGVPQTCSGVPVLSTAYGCATQVGAVPAGNGNTVEVTVCPSTSRN